MHHVIYIPASTQDDPMKALDEAGLADHASGANVTIIPEDQLVCEELRGGLLFRWDRHRFQRIEFDLLRWLPAMPLDGLPARRYFIGLDQTDPPRPHELLKPEPCPGSPVKLGDENTWVIPHAKQLPFDIIRNPQTGEVTNQPRPRFYAFWHKCLVWQRLVEAVGDTESAVDDVDQAEFLEEALRLNYRVTPELISNIRLFSTGPLGSIRRATAACLRNALAGDA